ADALQVGFGPTAVLVAASSQGSLDGWFARRALQARERLIGPASRAVSLQPIARGMGGVPPTSAAEAAMGGAR
ncbi:MAG TPA: hypothetical protein VK848_00125, partial [Acidimicrobiia bacterium]|nr:hypothetical protein [Acidimicrobiia bacterium]